jgi:uncharacterized membrane protein YphA (DoxX/SURF4 family)
MLPAPQGGFALRNNPISDILAFLTGPSYGEPRFLIVIFWILAAASVVIAAYTFRSVPEQRSAAHVVRWAVRFIVAAMWWQQSLWKFPTDSGGLKYWTEQIVQHAAFPLHGELVKDVILPIFPPFAVLVYLLEVLVAISLFVGLFVRASAILGGLLILNLWLGLYRAPQEWPWTYMFLILLMVTFGVENYGRSLGLDALLQARERWRARIPRLLLRFS